MSHVDTTDDLFQIALLVDQLRHDDVHHRVTAVRALVSIASALGTERTRDELIPFLTESTDDENEVLVVIAERLGELVRFVGGRDYAHILLTPLEPLVMSEQLSVREAAIASTETVVEYMSQDTFTNYYIPFVTR
jgi:serine/threonine-protein phosphatase 2A regulatory subunit A